MGFNLNQTYSFNKIWIGHKIGPVVSILAAHVDQWIPEFKVTMSGKDTAVGVHWSNSETTFLQYTHTMLYKAVYMAGYMVVPLSKYNISLHY